MNIVEKFLSIDGEGPTAGELAVFVRFTGCNLRCSWCDTVYSFDTIAETLSPDEVYEYIKSQNIKNVTLTGGEPLIQPEIGELLELLNKDSALLVHIETNGAVDASEFKQKYKNISFVFDYKLPQSGMTDRMCESNLLIADKNDVYKFVVGSEADLAAAYDVIEKYKLIQNTRVYLSPVLGSIEPERIVEFMKDKNMNGVRLQLQLHKFIWDKNTKGV